MTDQQRNLQEEWQEDQQHSKEELDLARKTLEEIEAGKDVFKAIRGYPLPDGEGFLSKHALITAYREDVRSGAREPDRSLLARIRIKPTRTLSGVTTVTVLTKPYPCPGECVFCPDHEEMPVSYLPDEPGAMRAYQHAYDPYRQVEARIEALYEIGHPTDKVELLILGGSWSAYRKAYQTWFIKRCFEAMNRAPAESLEQAQADNEQADHKNVGLVVETRPDLITRAELAWLRSLGVTKVQLGVQSLDDRILALNKRGHRSEDTVRAVSLLRAAGFKIVAHWMPNLVGASRESDREDFRRLWELLAPDELKIYPTQLLENTELFRIWEEGEYRPYTTEELIELIAELKLIIPRYCRVNRIVRDIPSGNVVEGNKRTSLRQDIQRYLDDRDEACECIRCREVRSQDVDVDQLALDDLVYRVNGCEEHFLSFQTGDDQIAGFLRLTLPGKDALDPELEDLEQAAVIREVHVYGQSLQVGQEVEGVPQHAGLGTTLLEQAEDTARQAGFDKIAVIAAVGTRPYYLDRGYRRGELYLIKDL
jgi:elongator complex protein 3